MVEAIKRICYKAIEEKMLRIYAIIMTGLFLSVWLPAMVNVVIEMFKIYG
jgi:hypothetical protein|tara:strand:- start:285 stop:434 length:150 start_codon:yes stop_codon:yes gene_type:complete